MIKKIVLAVVIVMVLLGIVYSMGYLDPFIGRMSETKISLEEVNLIDMVSQKGDIVLAEEGYYIVYDNIVETYDYKGQMSDIHEFDGFIEDTYFGVNKFVLTSNALFIEGDGGYTDLKYDLGTKKLLNISQEERVFLVGSDLEDRTNTVEVYDTTMKLLATYDSQRMRVIRTMDSENSDGVIFTTFSYEGSYMTSKIGEYLVEGMYNLWEIDLGNELVVFQYTAMDGIYVATNRNLYKINNEGSILWTYSGYDYIRDCEFSGDEIVLLTGKGTSTTTTINAKGKVVGIVETGDEYTGLDLYMGQVFLSNSSFISTIIEDKVVMAYNPDGPIKDLKLAGDRMRLLTDNSIVELSVKID